ncbi:HdeD family acid-resistance protein [Halegenticoccus tardaugens]|uniref:HdeD family acid-resistance protein n=1 Tax=Halegenticoccus tardaugens TaxID=2071624 RepID=UPI00100B01F4|nr:HdeD family acid-resistance protein [Halegenticoccus tardaugens]
MSETTESNAVEMSVENSARESWRYLLGAGILIGLLGLLAIAFPFVTGIALSVLLGAALVVGGVVHFAHAFSGRGWKGATVQVILAVVYVGVGIALIANPVVGLFTLTILLAAFFLADGLIEIYEGFRLRPEANWGWMLLSGVTSLALAGLIWIGFPADAAWAVGLLFGVNLLMTGLAMTFVAMGGRSADRDATAGMAKARGA